ncbi:hypothetical protein JOF29_002648 [Kribbella aluminosa]|uniref:Thaumatin family protein n=1 Tax=Kribbella aluminosa TaxID=416017 RepID=A0ABS4UIW9_9ACTN|nr:hypothetical protein [Kribbella aluminosa]MBP2351565.1 hypothetical protein [Kribbella aluminosa]
MRRMHSRWGIGAAVITLAIAMMPVLGWQATAAAPATSSGTVKPNATSMMDCNGFSPKYKSVKHGLGGLCTDPVTVDKNGVPWRFEDNEHYIGHDEPSVKFISSRPGSANDISYFMRLAKDPNAKPTVNSPAVSKYAQLSPAPWFGLPLCDPKSYPQNTCTANSDANQSQINNPNAAGSAFMELQFYPPGFGPFIDAPSCDAKDWCAALTIDSLSCTFGFATCNNNCIEPVNFSYLQTDGVPSGPPSPQLTDVSTLTPNNRTLKMRQGDVLRVVMRDTAHGLLARIDDLSTGRSGSIVASAANGFMNTNIADCTGTPFDFHSEFSSAQQQNQVPWAALEGGVLMQDELGHFEGCSSVSSPLPVSQTFANGQSFSDPKVFQVCNGGAEGNGSGEGPCDPATGICQNATTETGAACPTNDSASGVNCEFSGANCMIAGPRTTMVNGQAVVERWPIAGCQENVFQNGDLDFDGSSYQAGWPDGSAGHPTSFEYLGPFTGGGHPYPSVQFETNVAASEILCNTQTGAGCTAKPQGAAFYPFWSLGRSSLGGGVCTWNFGNVIKNRTAKTFGQTAQYGVPDLARFGGTLTSPVIPNPQLSTRC